jgi:uncharacterized protein YqjF (DUF2071 family)
MPGHDVVSTSSRAPFLRAEWRYLAMLNFEVEPSALLAYVPAGTELDSWNGRTYLSVVGFQFVNTRVLGLAIPFHRNFEEVNLRLYVRRRAGEGWRHAVVFIKEIVPRAAIAFTARALYNENYVALPMSHRLERSDQDPARVTVFYQWTLAGRDHHLEVTAHGNWRDVQPGSAEEFIAEHYWGYSAQPDGTTLEYQVEHPPWRVRTVSKARLHCDVARLYGDPFVTLLPETPASAFLAEGSEVVVHRGTLLGR